MHEMDIKEKRSWINVNDGIESVLTAAFECRTAGFVAVRSTASPV